MIAGNVLLFCLSAAFGVLGTWGARGLARRIGFVNHPNPIVPQHTTAVAYLGGVGAAVGVIGGLLAAWFLGECTTIPAGEAFFGVLPTKVFWGIANGGILFLLLGVVDDKWALSAKMKFAGQVLLAIGAAVLGVRYAFTGLCWLDIAISAFWILVVINAYNLTDVCDGLVSGISLLILLTLAILTGGDPLCLAAAGACLGVLRFNAPRASVFLGDAGSHFLGFLVATVTLLGGAGQPFWPWSARVLLICGIVLFELTLLVIVRAKKGLPWWKGSPDHFSLRLQAAGLSRWGTDIVAWSVTAVLCGLALAMDFFAFYGQFALLAAGALGLLAFGLIVLRWEVPPKQ